MTDSPFLYTQNKIIYFKESLNNICRQLYLGLNVIYNIHLSSSCFICFCKNTARYCTIYALMQGMQT
jgi:hypothetical protein